MSSRTDRSTSRVAKSMTPRLLEGWVLGRRVKASSDRTGEKITLCSSTSGVFVRLTTAPPDAGVA